MEESTRTYLKFSGLLILWIFIILAASVGIGRIFYVENIPISGYRVSRLSIVLHIIGSCYAFNAFSKWEKQKNRRIRELESDVCRISNSFYLFCKREGLQYPEPAPSKRFEEQEESGTALAKLIARALAILAILLAIFSPVTEDSDIQPDSNVEQPSVQVQTSYKYVASVNSDVYHVLDCDHAKKILDKNRVFYVIPKQAEADGKIPCSKCDP